MKFNNQVNEILKNKILLVKGYEKIYMPLYVMLFTNNNLQENMLTHPYTVGFHPQETPQKGKVHQQGLMVDQSAEEILSSFCKGQRNYQTHVNVEPQNFNSKVTKKHVLGSAFLLLLLCSFWFRDL